MVSYGVFSPHGTELTQLYAPSLVFHWGITSFEVPRELRWYQRVRWKHCSLPTGQREALLLQLQLSRHLTSEVFYELYWFIFSSSLLSYNFHSLHKQNVFLLWLKETSFLQHLPCSCAGSFTPGSCSVYQLCWQGRIFAVEITGLLLKASRVESEPCSGKMLFRLTLLHLGVRRVPPLQCTCCQQLLLLT